MVRCMCVFTLGSNNVSIVIDNINKWKLYNVQICELFKSRLPLHAITFNYEIVYFNG